MMDKVIKISGGVAGDFLKDAIKSQTFADVALCCTGGQRFLAHRLILSAASPYLYEVLRAHGTIAGQCEVITVILAEVEANDLEAILSFLYTGSAIVPKARLEAFSSAADALKIKIPPLPLALTLPNNSSIGHFNDSNYFENQSNIVENNNLNHLINDVNDNYTENVGLNLKIVPTECIRKLLSSQNYNQDNIDDYCINLKLPEVSSREVVKLKSHVANRVIASPWCQLAMPYHLPKIQPIIQQNNHLLLTENNCKEKEEIISPTVVAFSSTQPRYHSFIHERLTGPLSEITVGVSKRMYNSQMQHLPNEITVDNPQDMSRSTQMTSGKIQKSNDDQSFDIIHSPNVHLSSQDECQFEFKRDQLCGITSINSNGTIACDLLEDDDNKKISLGSVEAIKLNDNNNNNNNITVESKNGEITFTNDQQYTCHICKRTFINTTLLKIHSRCHSSEKPFRCFDCGKEFSQLRNYKYHRSVHEGTGEFSGTCPECGKCFNDRGYLGSHMKIHRNRKEYVCQECGKSFNQRVAYNMHVRIHSGVKPHHCEQCGKAFSRKMLLKQHLRTHSGERPYQCHICHKAFADRSNMTLHTRLHSGLKPYQCDICSKAFTKKHHLKTHLNYHTGTKPYSCPNCSVAFSQSSNMRTHYKKCMVNKPDGSLSNKIES
ncbi:hypothetical protein PV327_005486 [Microctonus hyperodae]|uniref:Uncharacterized protein n=1 Tax=Microctonus hyperodae TaxID=165561 RepID=A0AA39G2A4_MICHY|nr:hypothetical protein PV327_005486 [Microctonus hyperodae]